ncbi:MAG: RNA polymerase sigma factor region1.1 domain-containing protein, partial [Planktomarina sp.]
MAAKNNDDRKQDDNASDPMSDMSQTAVKKMIAEARERGYITYDQLNNVLPPDQVSSDQIEDVMSMLSEMGIQVTEEEEGEEDDEEKDDEEKEEGGDEEKEEGGDEEKEEG